MSIAMPAACVVLACLVQSVPPEGAATAQQLQPLPTFLSLQAPVAGVVPVDQLAREGAHVTRWNSARERRIELVECLDVNRWVVESDRGREVVRIAEIGGPDPRLSDEVNACVEASGAELLAWACEDGTRLVERQPSQRGDAERIVVEHWRGPSQARFLSHPYPDPGGSRVVALQRRDADGKLASLDGHAIQSGLAYAAASFTDSVACSIAPKCCPFVAPTKQGGPSVLYGYTDADLVARAEQLDEIVEASCGLSHDSIDVRVERVSKADLFAVLFRKQEQTSGRIASAADPFVTAEFSESFVELEVDRYVATLSDGMIHIFRHQPFSAAGLDFLLLHELAHVHQAALLGEHGLEGQFNDIAEAHAYVRASECYQQLVGMPSTGPAVSLDFADEAAHFRHLLECAGISADEALLAFASGTFDPESWSAVEKGRLEIHEWMFRHDLLCAGHWGLRFEVLPLHARLGVRITNTTDRCKHAQFSGDWLLDAVGRDEKRFASAPFNLLLPPGEHIDLEVAAGVDVPWNEGARVLGLFSPTFQPADCPLQH